MPSTSPSRLCATSAGGRSSTRTARLWIRSRNRSGSASRTCPTSLTNRSRSILLSHCLCYKRHELPHIFFGRIERAHPAHYRFLLDPRIEEVTLLDFLDRSAWNFRKHPIGLDRIKDLHLPDLSQFGFQ